MVSTKGLKHYSIKLKHIEGWLKGSYEIVDHLPEDAQIIATHYDFQKDIITFKVASKEFESLPDECELVRVNVSVRDADKRINAFTVPCSTTDDGYTLQSKLDAEYIHDYIEDCYLKNIPFRLTVKEPITRIGLYHINISFAGKVEQDCQLWVIGLGS